MKHIPVLILTIIFTGLLFPGCELGNAGAEPDEKTAEELKAELIDKDWELRTVETGEYATFVPEEDTMYTLTFFADGTFKGKKLCNQCGGEYEIDHSKNLVFTDFSCTEIACFGYQKEIDFRNTLVERNHSFHFEDNRLFINVNGGEEEAEFFKFAESSSLKDVVLANPENFNRSDWPGSYYSLEEAEITGDSLWVKVYYSGCGPHDLNVVFYNYFLESYPVQAHAIVAHKNEDCRAAFTSGEMFDLMLLKKEYQKVYGEKGTIDISVRQQDSTLRQLRYSF